jgi:hypothetical protein
VSFALRRRATIIARRECQRRGSYSRSGSEELIGPACVVAIWAAGARSLATTRLIVTNPISSSNYLFNPAVQFWTMVIADVTASSAATFIRNRP